MRKIPSTIIAALLIIIPSGLWWYCNNAVSVDPSQHKEPLTKLIEALITAFPLVFVTWLFAVRAEKINNHSIYINKSEKILQELECWAQEMCVCTVWGRGVTETKTREEKEGKIIETTRIMKEDEEIVTGQAAAGVKYAFIRHMLTRHGRKYNGTDKFPMVAVNVGGNGDINVWKTRFADAVIQYKKWYKELIKITRENGDGSFLYAESFVGLLYEELKVYGETSDSIMGALQFPLIILMQNPIKTQ